MLRQKPIRALNVLLYQVISGDYEYHIITMCQCYGHIVAFIRQTVIRFCIYTLNSNDIKKYCNDFFI